MRVNDLVILKRDSTESSVTEPEVGVIIETIEHHPGFAFYCLVEWPHKSQWWNAQSLLLAEEKISRPD